MKGVFDFFGKEKQTNRKFFEGLKNKKQCSFFLAKSSSRKQLKALLNKTNKRFKEISFELKIGGKTLLTKSKNSSKVFKK